VVRCLVKELSADVNKANDTGCTALFCAAGEGDLNMVRWQCLVKELGADVNQSD
jgi:ankyrin repeat protein